MTDPTKSSPMRPQRPVIIPPDSGRRPVGDVINIQPPSTGRDRIPAGPWAQTLLNGSFTSIRQHNRIISKVFKDIQFMPALHELFLRENRAMTGAMLKSFLDAKAANAESGLMTVTGEKMEIQDECDHCQEGRGPWTRCAVVRGPAGEGLACNNCHQLGRVSRCQKYVPPAGGVPQNEMGADVW